ncbi:MAG: PmoA family protein [Opitutaceae bacterium]
MHFPSSPPGFRLMRGWYRSFLRWGAPGLVAALVSSHVQAATQSKVTLSQLPDRVRVEVDGRLFTEYRFGPDAPKPFFHPILSADGTQLTRDFPMANVPGEEQDHPHHRSLWFAHGSVNQVDFWLEKPGITGRIVHDRMVEAVTLAPDAVRFVARSRWLSPQGKALLTDETQVVIRAVPRGRLLDLAITLHASEGAPVVFGDTKEGTMAVRLAQWMTLPHRFQGKEVPGVGQMVNKEGGSGAGIWGLRSAWMDYLAPRQGKVYGISIFDHPGNPRFPTWWHARDYGLFAANPFGKHDFEKLKDQPQAGDWTLPAGEKATFRYRFYIHEGDTAAAGVADQYRQFAEGNE